MANRAIKLQRREHDRVVDKLSAYLDDQLAPRDRALVEAHLGTCGACREDLRTLRWTRGLLREMPVVRVPRSFVVREADVAPQRTPRRRPLFAAQWATAVVTLLFVLVLAGDLLTGGGAMMVRQAAPAPLMLEGDAAPAVSEVVEQAEAEPVERPVQEKGLPAGPSPEAGMLDSSQEGTPAVEGTPLLSLRGDKGETADMVAVSPEKATEGQKAPNDRAVASKAMPDDGTPPVAVEKVVETEKTLEPPASPPARIAAVPEAEQATPAAEPTVEQATPERIERPADALTPSPEQVESTVGAQTPAPEQIERPADTRTPMPTPSPRPLVSRGVLRGAEVGLGVLLVGLVVLVVILRRR